MRKPFLLTVTRKTYWSGRKAYRWTPNTWEIIQKGTGEVYLFFGNMIVGMVMIMQKCVVNFKVSETLIEINELHLIVRDLRFTLSFHI